MRARPWQRAPARQPPRRPPSPPHQVQLCKLLLVRQPCARLLSLPLPAPPLLLLLLLLRLLLLLTRAAALAAGRRRPAALPGRRLSRRQQRVALHALLTVQLAGQPTSQGQVSGHLVRAPYQRRRTLAAAALLAAALLAAALLAAAVVHGGKALGPWPALGLAAHRPHGARSQLLCKGLRRRHRRLVAPLIDAGRTRGEQGAVWA